MTDRYPLANVAAVVIGEVNDGVVLHIGPRADYDFVDVATQGCMVPNAGFLMQGYPPDDVRAGGDEGAGVDDGRKSSEVFNGHDQRWRLMEASASPRRLRIGNYLTFPNFFLPEPWSDRYGNCMKLLMLVVAVLTLNSCNTMIGLGRDTKEGFIWSKNKIQGAGQQDPYGAPTY